MNIHFTLCLVLISTAILFPAHEAFAQTPAPGQIIVDPNNPRWLVRNKDDNADGLLDQAFVSGPGDPEDFLYRGTRNADGTRTGDQLALINKLKGTGANCIYFQTIRSHGGDGSSTHNPFVDSDQTKSLDQDILAQWETWFTELDNDGVIIFLFFYDDAIKVSSNLGWPLDPSGNLHAQERYFLETIVNAFEHHKHLVWVVMEEVQEMGSDYVAHTKKIAEAIRAADDAGHAIAVHKLSGLTFSEFADDPNIDQFAVQYNGQNAQGLHQGMLTAWNNAQGRYNLNMAEASGHYSSDAEDVRKKSWAAALGGAYVMVLGMKIADTPLGHLQDAGRLATFMESTNFNQMSPQDQLAFGGTQYVLAQAGKSYIAYAADLVGEMGLKDMQAGLYDFTWYDIASGASITQSSVNVPAGDRTWSKPQGMGDELAVFIREADEGDPPDQLAPADPENLRVK